jgi:hypothetical protein
MRQAIRVTGTETGTERGGRNGTPLGVAPETRLTVSDRGPI